MFRFRTAAAIAVLGVAAAMLSACAPADSTAPRDAPAVPAPTTPVAAVSEGEGEALRATADGVRLLDLAPISIDEFVDSFSERGGVLDGIDALNAEYRAAAEAFPLALPEGYDFPEVPSVHDSIVDPTWQQGEGAAQAFLFWERATGVSAFNDRIRNDDVAAQAHLDDLEAGYRSPLLALFSGFDGVGGLGEAVADARGGDVDALYIDAVTPFYRDLDNRSIAAWAGDYYDLGTEGYATVADDSGDGAQP